jgi:midasin
MDFYLASLPNFRERLSNDISPMHCMLLQELDLAVMLFLDEEDKSHNDLRDVGKHNEKDNSGQALRQIASVLAAMNSLGRKMLDSLSSDEWETRMVRGIQVKLSRSLLMSICIFRMILD